MATRKARDQIKREYFYLEKFLAVLQTKVESIERGANPPDFILKQGERCIAVEVTEFHSATNGAGGHPRRPVEEEWLKIQQLFRQERKQYPDLDSIAGLLFFKQFNLPPSGKHKQFVQELLDFGRSVIGNLTKDGSDFKDFGASFPLLNEYLKRLNLYKTGCYITWEWNHSASSVGLNESELQKTIFKKLEIPRPTNITENWVLVVSGHWLSQSMGLPFVEELREYQTLNKALNQGPYDKVFIFQYMFDRVLLWEPYCTWTEVRKTRFAGERDRTDEGK